MLALCDRCRDQPGFAFPQAQNAQPLEERFLLGVGTHQGLGGCRQFARLCACHQHRADQATRPQRVPRRLFRGRISNCRAAGWVSRPNRAGWKHRSSPGSQGQFSSSRSAIISSRIHSRRRPTKPGSASPITPRRRRNRLPRSARCSNCGTNGICRTRKIRRSPPRTIWRWRKAARPAVKRGCPNAPFVVGAIGDDPGLGTGPISILQTRRAEIRRWHLDPSL